MIKLLLPTAIFLMMVSIGTSFRTEEMWRNQKLMGWWGSLRLLLVVFVLPPALALALARLLPLSLAETGGLFLIAVAPGAPLLTRNVAKRGFDAQLAAVYQVWVAVLTPVMIPLLILFVGKLYDQNVWIPPAVLLQQVAQKQFLPLVLGMCLMYFAPTLATKIRPALNTIGNVVLYGFIALMLFKMRSDLAHITPSVVIATAILAVGSMAFVPWFMRTEKVRNRTLSICNANRHVGLALLLSGHYLHSKNSLPTVACYALIVPLVLWIYGKRFGALPTTSVAASSALQ